MRFRISRIAHPDSTCQASRVLAVLQKTVARYGKVCYNSKCRSDTQIAFARVTPCGLAAHHETQALLRRPTYDGATVDNRIQRLCSTKHGDPSQPQIEAGSKINRVKEIELYGARQNGEAFLAVLAVCRFFITWRCGNADNETPGA